MRHPLKKELILLNIVRKRPIYGLVNDLPKSVREFAFLGLINTANSIVPSEYDIAFERRDDGGFVLTVGKGIALNRGTHTQHG